MHPAGRVELGPRLRPFGLGQPWLERARDLELRRPGVALGAIARQLVVERLELRDELARLVRRQLRPVEPRDLDARDLRAVGLDADRRRIRALRYDDLDASFAGAADLRRAYDARPIAVDGDRGDRRDERNRARQRTKSRQGKEGHRRNNARALSSIYVRAQEKALPLGDFEKMASEVGRDREGARCVRPRPVHAGAVTSRTFATLDEDCQRFAHVDGTCAFEAADTPAPFGELRSIRIARVRSRAQTARGRARPVHRARWHLQGIDPLRGRAQRHSKTSSEERRLPRRPRLRAGRRVYLHRPRLRAISREIAKLVRSVVHFERTRCP